MIEIEGKATGRCEIRQERPRARLTVTYKPSWPVLWALAAKREGK